MIIFLAHCSLSCISYSKNNLKNLKVAVMKKQNQGYLLYVTKMELLNLTNIVEERLDVNYKVAGKKPSFTSAELWNMQRQRRSFVQRRGIM